MATGQLNGVLHSLQRAALWHGTEALTDADLLACFIAGKDESAFAGLVRRHGPMVFSVCRRVLGNIHDAEDAFQAAFLVLARKAASIWPRALVGNWLYGVAYRTALRAKSMIARRQAREKQVSELPDCAAPTASPWSNLWPLLDRELHALADKYRVPVILCDLEGQSQREAARQLGWPEGTLMTRLARARRMLAKRLNRRGVALSAGALATLLAQNTLSAAVPAPLALATVKAATFVAAGPATAVVSAEVAALTEGVLSTMFFAKIKSAALVLFVVAVLGSGAGFFAHRSLADRSAAAEPTPAAERPVGAADFTALAEQDRGDRKPDPNAANFRGKIVAVAKGGKSITIETPATERGGAPVKHDLKLTDKTEVKFFGVGLGGAKLAEGLQAQIWTTKGAKDVAAKILVGSRENHLGPDVSGKVTAVSKDGTTLSFEIGRGDNTKTIEIKLAIKTMLNYANVVKGGAKPTAGYSADVWLERGSKTVAAQVNFRGGSPEGGRIVKGGSISGTIAAVGDGGKVITLQTPPKERGGEPTKTDIKIDAKTHITYSNVSLAGEKLTEGYSASVSLVEGSKDTAAAIALMPPKGEVKERLKSLHGPVVGVAKDGKSFTIEVPPAERGQPVEKVTIKITEHTRVIFNSVGLNGARLTQGHSASVTLNEGSQDTAYLVIFTPFEPARR